MIKILQIDSYSGIGGGEVVMFNIVQRLKNDFDFIIAAPEGEFLEKYRQIGLNVFQLNRQSFLSNILKIRRIIKKEKPAIIHCHGTRAAFWGRLAIIGLKNKPKLIYTLHGLHIIRKPFFIKWLYLLIEKFLNHWTNILVCVGEADKELVLKYKTISKNKIVVIKNGIDIEKFQVDPETIRKSRKELGLTSKFILTFIGRLHPQKDVSTILKAMEIIRKKDSNIWQNLFLLIIGDGPLRRSLEKEAENLKVNSHLRFLGFRRDISVLINLSNSVILSTNWEGLPLTLLEAGASGKPAIASNIDGVKEIIIDNETGFLFKKGSAEDLTEKILNLYQDENIREKMSENAYNFISKNFNKERMVEEYRNLYQFLK